MHDIATPVSLTTLTNDALLVRLKALVQREQTLLAELLAHLAEVDTRRLYIAQGTPSLFVYCVEVLHYSEDAAYKRIQAARAARAYPLIFTMVASGELHLSAVCLLAAHLCADNHGELLALARHQSKRQVAELVAARFPKPDAAECLRRLPSPPSWASPSAPAVPAVSPPAAEPAMASPGSPFGSAAGERPARAHSDAAVSTPASVPETHAGLWAKAKAPRADLTPLSAERYRLQVTLSTATRDKLLRARDLLRHRLASGDLAEVIDLALGELVNGLEQRKYGKLKREGGGARSLEPAAASEVVGVAPGQAAIGAEADVGALDARHPPPGEAPSPSRTIPRAVRRAVAERDGYRCTFVAPDGRRCCERDRLEFHHVVPYAKGGPPTLANLRLTCRVHNHHQAVLDFGAEKVRRAIEARRGQRSPGGESRSRPQSQAAPTTWCR